MPTRIAAPTPKTAMERTRTPRIVRYATRRPPGHPHGAPMTYTPEPTPDPDAPGEGPGASGRRGLGCVLEILETLVLTLVIYLLIHSFVAQPFEVEQSSMVPTIVQHEYVLIDKISPHLDDYRRGDIVVFDPPAGFEQGGVPFIKRVIGLPGETVSLDNGASALCLGRLLGHDPAVDAAAVGDQPLAAEPELELLAGGLAGIAGVDQVAQAADAQVTTDGARIGLVRQGGAHHPTDGGDRIGSLQRHSRHRPAGDEGHQLGVEVLP